MFKDVSPQPNFPKLEEKILKFWQENKILPKYLAKNKSSKKRFSFLDGPITANNKMGVHHAWGRALKDLYQRYKNMQGFGQRFQNGFDNQGLWVEVEVEKKLGFKSKKDIEKYGIAKFIEKCKEHTLHFAKIQIEQSKRLGYFMNWGNDYYTMSDENNYAIWHFLKKTWQDDNLYKGRDSVPWCPRCGTAISQHEILSEEYQELTHNSIYLKFPLNEVEPRQRGSTSQNAFLVWTTTPWTIPGNVALAVNPELEYYLVKGVKGINFWIAGSLAEKVFGSEIKIVKKVRGEELVGLKYAGPFDELPALQKAKKENPETFHTVVSSKELVNEEEGTGIVHIATGCGTEDFRLGEEKNLPVLPVIDENANYLEGFGDLNGKNAKDNPLLVLNHPFLKIKVGEPAEDYIFDIKSFTHRYPVCWRCKSELVWRVVDEWYIAMDSKRHHGAKNYRQRLQEVIKGVHFLPSFGYERELDWLRNMEDWLISKKRYWGLALPIWECENCGNFEVIGSKQELSERAIQGWKEFEGRTPHRPWVDEVKIKCPKCNKLTSRIPDVGNPWLDAGIVSFSTLKYFKDKSYWQKWFPADLVLEGLAGQFKNWFYSLLTMSVVLENKAPFKTLLGHALVKDEKGEEMHKSKGNAIWFDDAAEKMGVDIMRWLYLRQNPAIDLNFGFSPAEMIRRKFFLIFWNCYKFFVTYANIDLRSIRGLTRIRTRIDAEGLPVLDKWILSRLNQLIKTVIERLNDYDNAAAARAIEDFVINGLSTWYIRRSRDRIGPTTSTEKPACYQTLHHVLLTLTKLMAPFTPFLSEEIYQQLTIPAKGRSASGGNNQQSPSVHLEDWPTLDESLIDNGLEKQMEIVRGVCERGHAARKEAGMPVRQPLAKITINNQQSTINNELIELIRDELNVKKVEFVQGKTDAIEVKLDTTLTPALIREGIARELIRAIQDLRKEAKYALSDKIKIYWQTDSVEIKKAIEEFSEYIEQKTLGGLVEGETKKVDVTKEIDINKNRVRLAVKR